MKTEDDPLDPDPVPAMRETLAAIRHLERASVDAGGARAALRRTATARPTTPSSRSSASGAFPIVGDGGGIWSFVHLDDAAAATVLAVERGAPGVYNVVDDEPAARARVAARARRGDRREAAAARAPRWLARLLAGEAGVVLMTEVRGASNAKAKRELGWTPRHPTWRRGFVEAYAAPTAVEGLPRAVAC